MGFNGILFFLACLSSLYNATWACVACRVPAYLHCICIHMMTVTSAVCVCVCVCSSRNLRLHRPGATGALGVWQWKSKELWGIIAEHISARQLIRDVFSRCAYIRANVSVTLRNANQSRTLQAHKLLLHKKLLPRWDYRACIYAGPQQIELAGVRQNMRIKKREYRDGIKRKETR